MTLAELAPDPGADYGEVFTRRWVVDLILDLAGYTPDADLGSRVLVEPSCGTGAFLAPIVDRLLESGRRHGCEVESLRPAIRAFDLLDANAERARKAVVERLTDGGVTEVLAIDLARSWVTTGDFLLHPHEPSSAHYVIGNPPYIRLESVPQPLMDEYRRICPTMRGRADIYVGFIERGLELLRPDGVLSFICADRWMRNQYGADLRSLIVEDYAVDAVISMHDVDAFEDDVSAYPAIVVLQNKRQADALVIDAKGDFGPADAKDLTKWMSGKRRARRTTPTYEASRLDRWFEGRDLWPAGSPSHLALVADLEARFPPLEDSRTATRVGIGVATGCDDVYITRDPDLVEQDRLLPLLQASDTASGAAEWSGTYLVNPWDKHGLVDLAEHPRLGAYLSENGERLRARHVAGQRPAQWYRTIDRVTPGLQGRPKLVIPDMKSSAHPVLDEGRWYPHHNLYYVVSDTWDPEVLGGLLISDIANLFVGAYCVKMRGGTYRFQAQYLRRIRVPDPDDLNRADRRELAAAFLHRDVGKATAIAARLYGVAELATASGTARVSG